MDNYQNLKDQIRKSVNNQLNNYLDSLTQNDLEEFLLILGPKNMLIDFADHILKNN